MRFEARDSEDTKLEQAMFDAPQWLLATGECVAPGHL
jgi:hypothetical protein